MFKEKKVQGFDQSYYEADAESNPLRISILDNTEDKDLLIDDDVIDFKVVRTNIRKHFSREDKMAILLKSIRKRVVLPYKRNFFFRMKFIRTIPNINNFKQLKMYYNAIVSKSLIKNKMLNCFAKNTGLKIYFKRWKRNTLDQLKQFKISEVSKKRLENVAEIY